MKETIKITSNHHKTTEHAIPIPLWQKLIPPTFLSLLTTVFYYPSLTYPFQFDDLANITKKFEIRSLDSIQWFTTSRWLGELTNRLNYKMGMFDPFYYRSFNLGIHILGGIITYFLIFALCSNLKKSDFLQRNAFWIASVTTALFLLHPMQTQTVSYVIQGRLEGLASTLGLAALLALFYGFKARSLWLSIPCLIASLGFGFLSCGAKEIVIVLPFLGILVDWFFIAEGDFKKFKTKLWFHGINIIMITAVLIYYIKPDLVGKILGLQLTSLNNRGNVLTQTPNEIITPLHYLISEFKVVLHYLTIFLWPFTMSAEYDWKLSQSILSPDAFLPLCALLAIIALSFYLVKSTKYRFVTFGLWWFFISVGPRSSIIPSPELICDYKTYLASFGWLFVIATILVGVMQWIATRPIFTQMHLIPNHAFALLLIATSFGFGGGTMVRNHVWRSSVEFWQDVIDKAPDKARAYNNLGVALSEDGKFEAAIPHFLKAIQLDHVYSDPWSNIAVAYSTQNEDDKAIAALGEAIKIFPHYPEAYNNLGTLYLKKQDTEMAEKLFLTALQLRPHYGKAFFNLGRMYLEKNEGELAWQHFKKATQADLDTPDGFLVLGQVSIQQKKYDEAILAFEEIKRRGISNQIVDFNLANAYFLMNNIEKAQQIYAKLTQEYPQDPRFAHNLGESYFIQQKYDQAIACFTHATQTGQNFAQAHVRIAHCYEKMDNFKQAREHLEKNLALFADESKTVAEHEIKRLAAQEKIASGNGTFSGDELQAILGPNVVKIAHPEDIKQLAQGKKTSIEKDIKKG